MPVLTITTPEINARIKDRIDQDFGGSARAFADHYDVSNGAVSAWVKGVRAPQVTADNQRDFASMLGVTPKRVLELAGFDLDDTSVPSEASRPYIISAAFAAA